MDGIDFNRCTTSISIEQKMTHVVYVNNTPVIYVLRNETDKSIIFMDDNGRLHCPTKVQKVHSGCRKIKQYSARSHKFTDFGSVSLR